MKEAKVICPSCRYTILMRTESQVIDGAIQEVECPQCKNKFKIRCKNTPNVYDKDERIDSNFLYDTSLLKKLILIMVLLSISCLILPGIMTAPALVIAKKKGFSKAPFWICTVIGTYIWIALLVWLLK